MLRLSKHDDLKHNLFNNNLKLKAHLEALPSCLWDNFQNLIGTIGDAPAHEESNWRMSR